MGLSPSLFPLIFSCCWSNPRRIYLSRWRCLLSSYITAHTHTHTHTHTMRSLGWLLLCLEQQGRRQLLSTAAASSNSRTQSSDFCCCCRCWTRYCHHHHRDLLIRTFIAQLLAMIWSDLMTRCRWWCPTPLFDTAVYICQCVNKTIARHYVCVGRLK